VRLKASHAGFFARTLQSSPGREVEAAEMLHLKPVSDGLPHQQVADFLWRIRPIRVAPTLLHLAPIKLGHAVGQAVLLSSPIDDAQAHFSNSAHLPKANRALLDSPREASRTHSPCQVGRAIYHHLRWRVLT
jgi:hypothetical protein